MPLQSISTSGRHTSAHHLAANSNVSCWKEIFWRLPPKDQNSWQHGGQISKPLSVQLGVPDLQKFSDDPSHLKSVKLPNDIPTNSFSEFYTFLSRLNLMLTRLVPTTTGTLQRMQGRSRGWRRWKRNWSNKRLSANYLPRKYSIQLSTDVWQKHWSVHISSAWI